MASVATRLRVEGEKSLKEIFRGPHVEAGISRGASLFDVTSNKVLAAICPDERDR